MKIIPRWLVMLLIFVLFLTMLIIALNSKPEQPGFWKIPRLSTTTPTSNWGQAPWRTPIPITPDISTPPSSPTP